MPKNEDDFFGGMFDFNGDGKTTLDESFVAMKILEDIEKEQEAEDNKKAKHFSSDKFKYEEKDDKPSVDENPKSKEELLYEINFAKALGFFIILVAAFFIISTIDIDGKFGLREAIKYNFLALVSLAVIMGITWFIVSILISGNEDKIEKIDGVVRQKLTEEELSEQRRNERIKIISVLSAVFAIIVIISHIPYYRVAYLYKQAVSQVDNGLYKEAVTSFEDIERAGYKDTEDYIYLCEAHMEYEEEDYFGASGYLDKTYFKYVNNKRLGEIEKFKKDVEEKCDIIIKKNKEKQSEKEYEILDYDYTTETTYKYKPKTTKKYIKDDDPYNVKDYANEEDFYDDNYDDFFDYYDAEDYYNEHIDD